MDTISVIRAGIAVACFCLVAATSPILHVTQHPARREINVNAKIVVNTTVYFPDVLTTGVVVNLEPTVDVPDMHIIKVTEVRVGSNLCVTGSLTPVKDYGQEVMRDRPYSLSLQYELGDVMNMAAVAADDADQQPTAESAFFVQYEADIFKPLLMDLGHVHEFGVTVETTHTRDRLYAKGVYTDFSLPLLFKSLGKQSASVAPEVAQMEIEEI
ncbi:uncharacterized protein LOC127846755 isoform X2 [Dreissena polymorpha]|uniref:Uncharacterized protein n=1 Tax=Dreissena polymorpha TaxID=45954 RepID=A0A9D4EEM0_DREPO|nr:uncharacterized protein LOC127846755 isoform X2 [Dreissena polymorpha]KAH3777704.1 hypothetical protein DPMN_179152 [Dreissena polymorpha]